MADWITSTVKVKIKQLIVSLCTLAIIMTSIIA
jgi:hypothetical protein